METQIYDLTGIENNQIITFPESQNLFKKAWFDECLLINSTEGILKYGLGAFVIPKNRIKEI